MGGAPSYSYIRYRKSKKPLILKHLAAMLDSFSVVAEIWWTKASYMTK